MRDLSRVREQIGEARREASEALSELELVDPNVRFLVDAQHCLGRTGVAVEGLARAVERLADVVEALADQPE